MISKIHNDSGVIAWIKGCLGAQKRGGPTPGGPGKNGHKISAGTSGQIGQTLSYRGSENLLRVARKCRNW
jgi:hypothetical protein